MKKNVLETVRDKLCLGCGVCQDVCPKHCIQIKHDSTNYPVVNEVECIDCGKCLKVCSGIGCDINNRAETLFSGEQIKEDIYLGRYLKCFSGYSTDYEIRYHSASGGCVSQFLIYLLEKNIVDGAVVTGFEKDSPMKPHTYIARSREEVLAARSSKYCVVSFDGIASEIINKPGKYVLVGLPCHIQAFRKFSDINKNIRDSIIGYFPIYCSSNKNMESQKYMLWRYRIDESLLHEFAYRDEGCLGKMFYRDKNRKSIGLPIDFLDYYRGIRAFFNVPRCNVCSDFYGELGDVCFGDLNKDDENDDPIGISSMIVRNEYWLDILNRCKADGYMELNEIGVDQMNDAQTYCSTYKKGEGFYATMKMRRFLRMKNPEFDNLRNVHPGVKAYIKALEKFGMYFIGKHRWMWPIIKMLDQNKNN